MLGEPDAPTRKALEELAADQVVPRIWGGDHTVWRPDPEEIADRLGWLTVSGAMAQEAEALAAFGEELRAEGCRDLVLLGMGGSSLGAEALYRILAADGPVRLHTLDSTVPGEVQRIHAAIDLPATFFLVASKSGTTAEVQALFDYFWEEADRALPDAALHFGAVTDPDTPLAKLALARGFRNLFLNPPEIGGRFSVLSYFGLVPAAILGIDVAALLLQAETAAADCAADRPLDENPAARLGAFLGGHAREGRDLLTLVTSSTFASFGLWAEQLVAESTGKEGRGILPIAGEPLAEAERYGNDRVFVGLALAGDRHAEMESLLGELEEQGRPVLRLAPAHPLELGYQLFLWQLATAVAGHLLDVHPFDQPNVQAAKSRTKELLGQVEGGGGLPALAEEPESGSGGRPRYVALLAYYQHGEGFASAVDRFRERLLAAGLPSTFGYGPRYLHSTGQLHKGGPPGGLHLVLTRATAPDVPIPGRSYGFATLAAAQAAGDVLALRESGRRVWAAATDEPERQLEAWADRLTGEA